MANPVHSNRADRAPPLVRWTIGAAVGLLLVGAGYLILMRGEALMVDLATLGNRVWCF